MKVFVFLAFIPSLIVADILCPNTKTTCPKGKQCCEVDGEYSCCDPQQDQNAPVTKMKEFPGEEIMRSAVLENRLLSVNESKLAYCDNIVCPGTCCQEGCCHYTSATCCGSNKCCPSAMKCCKVGCCDDSKECCGDGCCDPGYICCETWCCRKGYICGSQHRTCQREEETFPLNIFLEYFLIAASFVLSGRVYI